MNKFMFQPTPATNVMATGLMPPTSHLSQPSTMPTFSSPATGSIPIGKHTTHCHKSAIYSC